MFKLRFSFTAVHKTEVIKNTLNPTWREMSVAVSTLCNGDVHRSLKVECYDWDSDGRYVTPAESMFSDLNPQYNAKSK